MQPLRGPKLRAGDRVRVVAPSSFPSREWADQVMTTLAGWGLRPELGEHVLDQFGFMAGKDADRPGGRVDESARQLLFTTNPISLYGDPTVDFTVPGQAEGILVGGHAGAVSSFLGAGMPSLDGVILCFEGPQDPHFDRLLWGLRRAGVLNGVRGFAFGDLTGMDPSAGDNAVRVIRERLGDLGVPILGGLPFGHMDDQVCLPFGVPGKLDTATGTLTAEAPVC